MEEAFHECQLLTSTYLVPDAVLRSICFKSPPSITRALIAFFAGGEIEAQRNDVPVPGHTAGTW